MKCQDCKYYSNYVSMGKCKRHSPTTLLTTDKYEEGIFPLVDPQNWCGDFENKKEGE